MFAASGTATFERASFDDEADRRREIERYREKRQADTTALIAKSMRDGEGLVADMREQEEKKLAMRGSYAVGDVKKARAMAEKLDPKYVSPEELKKIFGGPAPINSKKPGGMGSGH